MHRTLTIVAVLAVLLATVQLHAQNLPITKPATMPDLSIIKPAEAPEPLRIPPPRPPWPPIRFVELRGYIYAINLWRTTVYYFRTTDGRFYWLVLTPFTKFYLCGPLTDYVGTGRLVIVKGFLWSYWWPYPWPFWLFATEVRDPAYPRCN